MTARKPPGTHKKRGRPTIYSDKVADEIIERLANGERITHIIRDPGMPKWSTICDWEDRGEMVNGVHILTHPKFAAGLARARVLFAELSIAEAGDLVDNAGQVMLNPRTGKPMKDSEGKEVRQLTHESIAHARSQANYRQWYAERVFSRRYGPKQTIEQTGPNGGPIQTQNANANFDREDLVNAFKTLIEKGV